MKVSGAASARGHARSLKVEPDRRGYRARRHIVRSAEGRQEIVERLLVRQIDDGETGAPLVLVAVEDLSWPTPMSKRLRDAMRGGLWSSSSVPGAGIESRVEPYRFAGQRPVGLIGVVGVAWTLPQ